MRCPGAVELSFVPGIFYPLLCLASETKSITQSFNLQDCHNGWTSVSGTTLEADPRRYLGDRLASKEREPTRKRIDLP